MSKANGTMAQRMEEMADRILVLEKIVKITVASCEAFERGDRSEGSRLCRQWQRLVRKHGVTKGEYDSFVQG